MRDQASLIIRSAALSLALCGLVWASPAGAVDGVVEINASKAAAGGVTPGDPPGYPVFITVAGSSYVLTSDLVVPAGVSGIYLLIGSDDVSIDLNGFSIVGPNVCVGSGPGITCPAGAGFGIGSDPALFRTTVKNGTVRGFSGSGVALVDSCHVENVAVSENTGAGLDLGANCLAIRNRAERNAGVGISALLHAKVENNVSIGNGLAGIEVSDHGLVLANVVGGNGFGGIFTSSSSTIGENEVAGNSGYGIKSAGPSSRILANKVSGTLFAVPILPGKGVECGDGCTINDNAVTTSALGGILCGQACAINENTSSMNGGDGIFTKDLSSINHNTASLNGGSGIHCDSPSSTWCSITGNIANLNGTFGLELTPAPGAPPAGTFGTYRSNVFSGNPIDVSVPGADPGFMNSCTGGAVPCP